LRRVQQASVMFLALMKESLKQFFVAKSCNRLVSFERIAQG